jgi:ElaB/YqjD/DUF883 family membrane-anchored ribosome-binding protein
MTEQKAADGTPSVEALRAEIRQTRAELGETVQALAARADVKARVKESAAQTAAHVRESAEQAVERARESAEQAVERARESMHSAGESARRRPIPWLAVATGAAVIVVFLIIRRRRG